MSLCVVPLPRVYIRFSMNDRLMELGVVKMWANEADHLTQKGVVFYREIADNALRSLLDEYSGQPIQ